MKINKLIGQKAVGPYPSRFIPFKCQRFYNQVYSADQKGETSVLPTEGGRGGGGEWHRGESTRLPPM